MRAFKSYVCFVSILILLVASVAGCGDSTRNDQGISFSFTGWFADIDGSTGYSFGTYPLSFDQEAASYSGGVPDWAMGGEIYAGLINNLDSQFIRVERIRHSYYIPGASVQPPSTSIAAPFLLNASPAEDPAAGEDFGVSTLPESSGESANEGYVGTVLLTPDVMTFINLNRQQFPEPPFVMIITSYAVGTTSSGKAIESNPIEFSLTFTPDTIIPPGQSTGTSSMGESSESEVDYEVEVIEGDTEE